MDDHPILVGLPQRHAEALLTVSQWITESRGKCFPTPLNLFFIMWYSTWTLISCEILDHSFSLILQLENKRFG